jgi:hypothetical protein
MTDDAGQYRVLGSEFARHESVNHGADEYVRGDAYTNTVEGYFALTKRGIYGQFHSVSEAHLHRYLAEFDFRHNNRKMTDLEWVNEVLRRAQGKRLMYRQPDQASDA